MCCSYPAYIPYSGTQNLHRSSHEGIWSLGLLSMIMAILSWPLYDCVHVSLMGVTTPALGWLWVVERQWQCTSPGRASLRGDDLSLRATGLEWWLCYNTWSLQGLETEYQEEGQPLGRFTYDQEGDSLQMFHTLVSTRIMPLSFMSLWGQACGEVGEDQPWSSSVPQWKVKHGRQSMLP